MRPRVSKTKVDPATKAFLDGLKLVNEHPMFGPLASRVYYNRDKRNLCPPDGWIVMLETGIMHVHPTRRGTPEEWAYAIAHAFLHLGFEHFRIHHQTAEWNIACCVFVTRFLHDLKFGRVAEEMRIPLETVPAQNEDRLFEQFRERGIPEVLRAASTAGPKAPDMLAAPVPFYRRARLDWADALAEGLLASVQSAVRVAGGYEKHLGAEKSTVTMCEQARRWFLNSFPLLGALAASFTIVEDPDVCRRLGIAVAAVDTEAREILVNAQAILHEREARFVIAHELLHAGLRHETRRRGRDPHLWNVACDYVINDWLLEMKVGTVPTFGGLHDPELRGLSADAIYDRLAVDLRRNRKLATLRGVGDCDMLDGRTPDWWARADAISLDDFYRRALGQGLIYHEQSGRGTVPAGLVEAIRALDRPPIPWDVELAQWFDERFDPLEKRRTYSRQSRRQSATPDIPRPRYEVYEDVRNSRTFGVVLDTSGSMDRTLLARALGTIASYSIARDVLAVRLVFCDAAAYDEGYVTPEAIADRVRVRGRGGTVLQPGLDLLEKAEDFPKDGPILIITDGYCDRLIAKRDHAFLVPQGKSLPFVPKGPVFWLK